MKTTISCDIIRDLLPIYLENLASMASAAVIEGHLQSCEDCRTIYEDMKKPLPIETQQVEVVDSLKKFRRSLKLRNIVILLLAIGILISVLKVFVIGSVTEFGEVDIESWTYNTDGSVTLDASMRSGRSMGRYKLIPQDENGQINIMIYSVANLPLRSSNDFSITIPFGEGASIIWQGKNENIVAINETAFATYIAHVSGDNTLLFGDWITNKNKKSKIQDILDGARETTILQTDTIRSVGHIMIVPGSNRVSIEQERNKEYEVRYYAYEINDQFYLEELKHFFGEEYEIRENTTTRDIVATIPNRKYVKEISGKEYAELLQLTQRIS